MDPETQALLQYLSTNFGLGAPVPNVNMALPFAEPPPAPNMNDTFGAAGVPKPESMPREVVTPPLGGGRPPYSGRTGQSLGELLTPEPLRPDAPLAGVRPGTYTDEKLSQFRDYLRGGVENLGQRAVDYMRPRVEPPVVPGGIPPMAGGPVPYPQLGFLTKTVQEPQAPDVPPTTYTPGSVVPDQTSVPQTAQATVASPAQAGGNKLIDALRGVVAPKPPDVQRPVPTREVQPHKIESTIAMLASLGITPKDLMHIPSLGQSLRG